MLRILRIKAESVHGYIPIDISFNDDLTFLTGSNGCGKTTVLKLISAVLQPNFGLLNDITFSIVRISFMNNNIESFIELKKEKDKNKIEGVYWTYYEFETSGFEHMDYLFDEGVQEINEDNFFRFYPKLKRGVLNHEEHAKLRESVYNEFINGSYYNFVQQIINPINLGINRQLIGNDSSDKSRIYGSSIYARGVKDRSFIDAQRVVIDYVSGMADDRKNLIETFKSNIFKSLFEYIPLPKTDDIFTEIDPKSFNKRKNATLLAIKNLELSNEIASEIEIYYDSLLEIQPKVFESKKDDHIDRELNEWFVNRAHLQRIEAISKYAKTYQEAIDKLDLPLNEITKIANSFLNESNKSLKISASGKINVVWSEKEVITDNLSSGEMQLIVIIVHLVFWEFRRESSVFMIDEPELSLHISWQEKFVDAILKASPSTQFILATHSPAIIATLENETKAIYLNNI